MRKGEGEEGRGGETEGHTSVLIRDISYFSGLAKRLLFRGISQECQIDKIIK